MPPDASRGRITPRIARALGHGPVLTRLGERPALTQADRTRASPATRETPNLARDWERQDFPLLVTARHSPEPDQVPHSPWRKDGQEFALLVAPARSPDAVRSGTPRARSAPKIAALGRRCSRHSRTANGRTACRGGEYARIVIVNSARIKTLADDTAQMFAQSAAIASRSRSRTSCRTRSGDTPNVAATLRSVSPPTTHDTRVSAATSVSLLGRGSVYLGRSRGTVARITGSSGNCRNGASDPRRFRPGTM